jgi:hypothetical protein
LRWRIEAWKMKLSSDEKPADSCSSPVGFSSTFASSRMRSSALPGFCSTSNFYWK